VISRATSGVIPIFRSVHKNARFKYQPSTPRQSFVSIRSTPFMEIDVKEGEVGTKICKCIIGEKKLDMDKEGAILKNGRGSKFLNNRSTQVGRANS
jgi:hypothetical protein